MSATRPEKNDETFKFYIPEKNLYKPESVKEWLSAHHIQYRWHIDVKPELWSQMINQKLEMFEMSPNHATLNMVELIGHQVQTSLADPSDLSKWRVVLNNTTFLDIHGHRDPNPIHYW